MTGILGQLKWEPLKKRRKYNILILLYNGLKGKASVPTDDLIPKTRRCRNQHSMAFQTPIANTDVYKGSFFPQTIRDWNALPDSLISSAEDAEDCVAKFTSLSDCRFGVSPVNYPDPVDFSIVLLKIICVPHLHTFLGVKFKFIPSLHFSVKMKI